MPFTLDSTLSELLENAVARQILLEKAPDLAGHPMIAFVKSMTLRSLLGIPQVAQYGISVEKVEKVLLEINTAIS